MKKHREDEYLKNFYPIPKDLSDEERMEYESEIDWNRREYRRRRDEGLYLDDTSFFSKIKGKLNRGRRKMNL